MKEKNSKLIWKWRGKKDEKKGKNLATFFINIFQHHWYINIQQFNHFTCMLLSTEFQENEERLTFGCWLT